jgi:hypothetical protein
LPYMATVRMGCSTRQNGLSQFGRVVLLPYVGLSLLPIVAIQVKVVQGDSER